MHTFHASVCVCKLFSHSQRFFLHHIWIDQFSFFFLHMPKMLYTRAYTNTHALYSKFTFVMPSSCWMSGIWLFWWILHHRPRKIFYDGIFSSRACVCVRLLYLWQAKQKWYQKTLTFPQCKAHAHTHARARARTHNRFYCRPVLRSLLHAFTFLVETKMTAKNRDESVTPLFVSVSVCSTMRNCLYVWVSVKKRSAEKRKPHQECES